MTLLIDFFKGIAVGLANIIPGVSGGTMLLILGIYSRVIRALRNIDGTTIKAVFGGWQSLREALKRLDALFMGTVVLGAVAAVAAMAKVMTYLLTTHHDPTYGFFFGLVFASVLVPYRMIHKKSLVAVLACLIGIGSVVGISVGMSAEDRLASEKQKVALKAKIEAAKARGEKLPKVAADLSKLLLFFFGGVIAAGAMILPGISGSFMLLMMGIYFDVLAAIKGLDLPLLGVIALGAIIGLLLLTRVLNYLLENYHDLTLSFLLGLVVGSLWAIWPFKTFEMVGDKRVDLVNTLPAAVANNELLTGGAALFGCAIVGLFIWLEARNPRPEQAR